MRGRDPAIDGICCPRMVMMIMVIGTARTGDDMMGDWCIERSRRLGDVSV